MVCPCTVLFLASAILRFNGPVLVRFHILVSMGCLWLHQTAFFVLFDLCVSESYSPSSILQKEQGVEPRKRKVT